LPFELILQYVFATRNACGDVTASVIAQMTVFAIRDVKRFFPGCSQGGESSDSR
jgi:hypothetical protein